MKRRDSIKAKIAALRAKTTAAGCTEAEAIAAAELAARLMAEHGLSETEIEMSQATCNEKTQGRTEWRAILTNAIALATSTASVWTDRSVIFVGRAPGPEVAAYVRDVCFRASDRETKAFQATTWYRRRRTLRAKRAATNDFRTAFARRLASRVLEIFAPQISSEGLKAAERALAEFFPATETRTARAHDERYWEAGSRGSAAAKNVPLSPGVGGGTGGTLAIGGSHADA